MSDWIDKSVEKQHSELERCINNARTQRGQCIQKKIADVVICSECLEPIPKARLAIKPDATHCVDCLAEMEAP
ncbi:TraR/DksA C4-type zinc finger protein [Vibrio antiquarius]|uniref:TraR/DksA C4-type zinc finger protein n=1 Tax=Vibrio TaxID=662 RepID=UPI0026589561|nr:MULTISPECIES: TraR/DksA C4-type zinc finger protein [Vibrio]MCR9935254.1 TraR/DksA C4-type zinc finger protein [Vibrio antiquarius]MDW1799206.1 TraR/DksA C4-type zinc finger protein [Vibrio sp. Vb2201]